MTRAVAISGTRRTGHCPPAELARLLGEFLAPFVSTQTPVFLGGAKGVDTAALRWLVERGGTRLTVVVPGTVADQPEEAQAVIAEARTAGAEVVELRHPEFPSAAAYHARNRWMVDRADLLVAFPHTESAPASGTCYTIDYAAERRLPRIIVPI